MNPLGPIAITADDYGLTEGVNRGIEELAEHMAITGVSVMCHSGSRLATISRLRNTGVATGVHLTFVEERPILFRDPGLRPLLDTEGHFPSNYLALFRAVIIRPWILPALAREAEAQMSRFLDTGLSLDFINSHQHVHLFPPIWLALSRLWRQYRVPVRVARSFSGGDFAAQGLVNLSSWIGWRLRPIPDYPVTLCPLGLSHAGSLALGDVVKIISREAKFTSLGVVPELVTHPGYADQITQTHYAHWRYHWDQERELLGSELLRNLLDSYGGDLLAASIRIKEAGKVSGGSGFPGKDPMIRVIALNLRLEGHVSALVELVSHLRRQGMDADFLLPEGLNSLNKADLEDYMARPFFTRLRRFWTLLRTIRARMGHSKAILHLVLPSPAFAWMVRFVQFPQKNILLQYERLPIRLDFEHLRAFWDDPGCMAPWFVLNHPLWSWLACRQNVAHLAVGSRSADHLKSLGFSRVFEAANLRAIESREGALEWQIPEHFCAKSLRLVGYVGPACPGSGVDDLLSAFALATKKKPELRLLLAFAGGGDVGRVRWHVKRLELTDMVWITGLVPIEQALKRLAVLVLPYRSAINTAVYPNGLLAADVAECQVITTAIAAWEDIFDHDAARLQLVTPRDVSGLARALLACSHKTVLAPQPILRLPTTEESVKRIREIYRHIWEKR